MERPYQNLKQTEESDDFGPVDNTARIQNPLSLDRPVRNPNSLKLNTLMFGDTLVAKTPGPEDQCIFMESANSVRQLLRTSGLNWAEKRAVAMRILQDLDPSQIAEIMCARSRTGAQNLIESTLVKIQANPQFTRIIEDHS